MNLCRVCHLYVEPKYYDAHLRVMHNARNREELEMKNICCNDLKFAYDMWKVEGESDIMDWNYCPYCGKEIEK